MSPHPEAVSKSFPGPPSQTGGNPATVPSNNGRAGGGFLSVVLNLDSATSMVVSP